MSTVDGVNNNSNKGLYVAGATAIGAGAGVGAAYLTKPFLKDDAPTDEFCRTIYNRIDDLKENGTNDGSKVLLGWKETVDKSIEEQTKDTDKIIEKSKKCTTVDDLKNLANSENSSMIKLLIEADKSEEFVKCQKMALEEFKNSGAISAEEFDKLSKELENITPDNLDNFTKKLVDIEYRDKSLEEALVLFEKDAKEGNRGFKHGAVKEMSDFVFDECWDTAKNTFKDTGNNEINTMFKKAVRDVQGKYALIYGSIGAGILGLGTMLFKGNGKNKNPENFNRMA